MIDTSCHTGNHQGCPEMDETGQICCCSYSDEQRRLAGLPPQRACTGATELHRANERIDRLQARIAESEATAIRDVRTIGAQAVKIQQLTDQLAAAHEVLKLAKPVLGYVGHGLAFAGCNPLTYPDARARRSGGAFQDYEDKYQVML